MPWARFDDRFPAHRKVRPLSDAAFRLCVSAVCWCAANPTDGFIADGELRFVADIKNARRCAEELVAAGIWAPAVGGHWILPGFFSIDRDPRYAPGQRERIYAKDGHRCVKCESDSDLTIDHVHPRALGGSDRDENLRTLCRSCNSRKGASVQ